MLADSRRCRTPDTKRGRPVDSPRARSYEPGGGTSKARVSAMADWASRKVLSPLMLFASQVALMNQHLPLPNTEIFFTSQSFS